MAHDHPTLSVTDKTDLVRLKFSTELSRLQAQIAAYALQSRLDGQADNGLAPNVDDILKLSTEMGRVADAMHFKSPALEGWITDQRTHLTAEHAGEIFAEYVNRGDVQGLMDYATAIQNDYPVPILKHDYR